MTVPSRHLEDVIRADIDRLVSDSGRPWREVALLALADLSRRVEVADAENERLRADQAAALKLLSSAFGVLQGGYIAASKQATGAAGEVGEQP